MSAKDFECAMTDVGRTLVAGHVQTGPLCTAHPGDQVAAVAAWAKPAGINNVPVIRDGHVAGVLENLNGDYGDRPVVRLDAKAAHAMVPLHAGMLLESRAPLAELVGVLLKPPHYRLILDQGRVEAIVTPSDLVKLPMRVLVFGAVAHLEHAMLDALDRLFTSEEEALSMLDADNQAQVLDLYDKLQQAELNPSLLEVASLKQKARALTAAGVFGDVAQANADFDDIVLALRNPVMHAAAFVDDSLDALRSLDRRLKAVDQRTRQAHQARRRNRDDLTSPM